MNVYEGMTRAQEETVISACEAYRMGKIEPNDVIYADCIEDDRPVCEYCDAEYADDSEMGMIRYEGKFGIKAICADCFFDLIGWYDARMYPRTEEYEPDFEEAAYILRHMLNEVTGIPVVDDHFKELLAAVERVVDLKDRLCTAKVSLNEMRKGVA